MFIEVFICPCAFLVVYIYTYSCIHVYGDLHVCRCGRAYIHTCTCIWLRVLRCMYFDICFCHRACIWYVVNGLSLSNHPCERTPITVRCRYNAVNFLPNPHKIHIIARWLGRDMGCNLWFDTQIYIMFHSAQSTLKYRVILDRVITALGCTYEKSDIYYIFSRTLFYFTRCLSSVLFNFISSYGLSA